MSSSASAASSTTYEVVVTPTATGNVLGLVIEFCSNSPIIGEATCNTPSGLTTASSAISGWTRDGASDANTDIFTRASGTFTSGSPQTLTLTGMTNPTHVQGSGTFYARIVTYTTAAGAQAYTSATPGTHVDDGGVALSTAAQITVTSKVQETLTFCIYTGANCAAGGSAITIGDANGVLSTSTAYHNADADFDVATNALSGVVVRMKGATLTSSSGPTITAIGASAASSSAGSEQFGMCVSPSGGSATAASPYNHANCGNDVTSGTYTGSGQFAFDTNGTDGTTSTYGDSIASSSGPTTTTVGTLNFLANIANTTEAGIYTTTLTFIATGTY